MNNSYYQNQLFNPIDIDILPIYEDSTKEEHFNPVQTDGLVYNHMQQALQLQTDLKNQQRVQDFLNSAITEGDSILGFDELYSSVTTESDLSYLQLMQHNTTGTNTTTNSFYTPLEPLMNTSSINDCSNNYTFDISSLPSVAGLDTSCTFPSPQPQYELCHPLSSFPDAPADNMACDYYLDDHTILAGIDCNAFNASNNYLKEVNNNSSYMHPLQSYSSFSINQEDHRTYRNNSTPLLSASYSFSSFSSASSNEDDSPEEDLTVSVMAEQRRPKKSASISFLPEQRRKLSTAINRKNSVTKPQRKFTQKHSSISSDSLSYYLSKQRLSDNEEYEEEYEDDEYQGKSLMSSSASSGMICKKGRNVDKACNHCKRSHLRCDNVRPCHRCVATGKTGCQDVKHKPRGRPRLQKRLQ